MISMVSDFIFNTVSAKPKMWFDVKSPIVHLNSINIGFLQIVISTS